MSDIRRATGVFGGFVAIALVVLAIIYSITADKIEQVQSEYAKETLLQLLPVGGYDNDPLTSAHWVTSDALGSSQKQKVFPAYNNEKPVAAVLSVSTQDGYNGEIKLLLGIDVHGTVLGSRVIDHSETPGLGDDVELHKSKWILDFSGHSLGTTENSDWTVKKYGGQFDAFTGATITPRAVIQAVHKALVWFHENPEKVFPK